MNNVIKRDDINQPAHYTHGDAETIDVIEHVIQNYPSNMSFSIGNVIKYLDRALYKDHMSEDLKKAQWYLDHAIKLIEGSDRNEHPNR